jgi:molybdate transport system ATP-binding protein
VAQLDLHLQLSLRSYALDVAVAVDGGTLALVGPSGAGKTTVVRALAGLRRPDAGHVRVDGRVWFDGAAKVALAPEHRSVGVVFQDYALFPHMTVAANVAFARGAEPLGLLGRFGVGHLAGARPGALSGGERQRVALARALARDPQLLLLDEPLSALDTHTRAQVREELGELLREVGLTTLLVTHDFRDAAVLADRVAVIVDGRLRQLGTPQELVDGPDDAFVASFTGATVVRGQATARRGGGSTVVLDDGGGALLADTTADGAVQVAVQPWNVALDVVGGDEADGIRGRLGRLTPEGSGVRVRVGPLIAHTTHAALQALGAEPGDPVRASVAPAHVRVFKSLHESSEP